MSFLGIFDDMPDYKATDTPGVSPGYSDSVQQGQDYANRPLQDFTNEANRGVKEQSNLMGPRDPNSTPEDDALSARAAQSYQSNINQVMRQAPMDAMNRKMGLEANAVNQQAALFHNAQSRAEFAYKQAAMQRQSAIDQEISRRQILGAIFGGLLGAAGTGAGMATSPSSVKRPAETGGTIQTPNSADNFSYNSQYFGPMK